MQHIQLSYVGLTGAELGKADLTGAMLTGADLQEATMSSVTLRGADLAGANLTGADLSWADLSLAHLTEGTNVDSVVWDNATCPDGTLARDHQQTCIGHLTPGGGIFSGEFVGLDLRLVDLTGVTFSDADLRLSRLDPGEDVTWIRVLCPNGLDSDTVGGTCENEHDFADGQFANVNAPGYHAGQ